MPLRAQTFLSAADSLSDAYTAVPPPGWSCRGFHEEAEDDEDLYLRDEEFKVLFDGPGMILVFDGETYRGLVRRANTNLHVAMRFWARLRELGLTLERFGPTSIPGVSAQVFRKLTDEEKESDARDN